MTSVQLPAPRNPKHKEGNIDKVFMEESKNASF